MTKAEIEKKLSSILKRLAPLTPADSKAGLPSSSAGSNTVPLDSVVVLQLVLAIEEEFGVTVEDEDIGPDNFGDLAALCAFVDAKLHAA
jgi:acyl carrier protein